MGNTAPQTNEEEKAPSPPPPPAPTSPQLQPLMRFFGSTGKQRPPPPPYDEGRARQAEKNLDLAKKKVDHELRILLQDLDSILRVMHAAKQHKMPESPVDRHRFANKCAAINRVSVQLMTLERTEEALRMQKMMFITKEAQQEALATLQSSQSVLHLDGVEEMMEKMEEAVSGMNEVSERLNEMMQVTMDNPTLQDVSAPLSSEDARMLRQGFAQLDAEFEQKQAEPDEGREEDIGRKFPPPPSHPLPRALPAARPRIQEPAS